MSTNDSQPEKDPLANAPTPEYDILGLADLSQFEVGDEIVLEGHSTPLTVVQTGHRRIGCANGDTATAHALALKHDRDDATRHEIIEDLNGVDGTPMGIVDGAGCPIKVFLPPEVAADE